MPLPDIRLTGFVVGTPSFRYTERTGKAVCNFRVRAFRLEKRDDKWNERDDTYLSVVAWERLAELCGDALGEGTEVTVIGELKQRDFQGVGNSEDQTRFEVTAKHVALALPLKAQREKPQENPDDPWDTRPPDDPWAVDA